jgi:hypothetical protein
VKIEDLAKICHQANKAYCESLGDSSQVDWEQASQQIRESAISGIKLHFNNPSITPEQQHEEWCRFKREQGYILGAVKDDIKKTHHCLVPYEELPLEQQIKDHLYTAIVKNLISNVEGFKG